MSMQAKGSTLNPEPKEPDPYAWVKGDESYELPAEILEMLQGVPEVGSMTATASLVKEMFENSGPHMGRLMWDPAYTVLTLAERKFIGTVVSAINGCVTCLILHSHALGELIADHGRARRLAINYRSVTLSDRERAIGDFVTKLTETPSKSEPADLEKLRDVGLSDQEIYWVTETASTFNYTNRVTSALGYRPDDEFMESLSPPTMEGE